MTHDFNPADWDWEKLQQGIESLRMAAMQHWDWGKQASDADDRREYQAISVALDHTANFIEFNIDAGDIKSPLQTYLTEK